MLLRHFSAWRREKWSRTAIDELECGQSTTPLPSFFIPGAAKPQRAKSIGTEAGWRKGPTRGAEMSRRKLNADERSGKTSRRKLNMSVVLTFEEDRIFVHTAPNPNNKSPGTGCSELLTVRSFILGS
ncbi:hypothetical protein CHS0354_031342 [Potamilus streckersoni]|uniref:Uncharacterized protein n=1 Tax=Potamilus streckersoni TaxID=2493646 RepID=A0AAE0S2K6_9BIVA|nr:hypothetical protein CHS0354_031342 [Potamilus streckersoni]